MNKKVLLLFALLFSVTTSLFSQTDFTENNLCKFVIKKSGREINAKVKSVKFHGIIWEDERTIGFQVISKFETENKDIVDSVLVYAKNVKQSYQDGRYILDMSDANYKKGEIADRRVLQDGIIGISIMSNRAENFEAYLNVSPRILNALFLRMSYSYGKYSKEKTYSCSSVAFGLGLKSKIGSSEILGSVNYGPRSVFVDGSIIAKKAPNGGKTKYSPYLEVLYRMKFLKDWLFVSVGGRYIFSNITIDGNNTKFGVNV